VITISNRWISNSISYAEVAKIANLGHQYSNERDLSHCPTMTLSEKIYDYVLCGSVKQKLIHRLYKMSRTRAELAKHSNSTIATTGQNLRYERNHYRGEMREYEVKISRLLSGSTLKFATNPIQSATYADSYLIYRDQTRRNAVGIRMQAPRPTLPGTVQIADSVSFDSLDQIQVQHLDAIKKNTALRFEGQLYEIRFTKNNGPVIIHADGLAHRYVVQKRLLSLWAIAKVKNRLAEFRNHPSALSALNRTYPDSGFSAEQYGFQFLTGWLQFVGPVQGKFAKSVDLINRKLALESRDIEAEVDSFERLTNPNRDQKNAFRQVQEKITLLDGRRKTVEKHLQQAAKQLERLSWTVTRRDTPVIIDAFRNRMLHFIDQMSLFILSDMSAEKTKEFDALCQIQRQFSDKIDTRRLRHTITPRKIRSWNYSLHPPVLHAETRLLSLVQNCAISDGPIREEMTKLRAEQNAAIDLRIRQIELGELITTGIRDFTSLDIGSDPLTPESCRMIWDLRKISNQLLTPENNFTHADLDTLQAKKERYFWIINAEYKKRLAQ